jgi:hypothetical protein
MANAEVFERALGLSAPEPIRGDLNNAKAIGLFSRNNHLTPPSSPILALALRAL